MPVGMVVARGGPAGSLVAGVSTFGVHVAVHPPHGFCGSISLRAFKKKIKYFFD